VYKMITEQSALDGLVLVYEGLALKRRNNTIVSLKMNSKLKRPNPIILIDPEV
jgi:hypothetical protein